MNLKEGEVFWELVIEEGNDWGNPNKIVRDKFHSLEELKKAVDLLGYYDTIISIGKITPYTIDK